MLTRVVALDPGFSAAGAVTFELQDGGWVMVDARAFRPPKDTRKKSARQSLEDAERVAKLARGVAQYVRDQRARYLLAELPDAGGEKKG